MKKDRLIITIGREYGSGGKIIGEKLAEKLGINFYDKEIIDLAVKTAVFLCRIMANGMKRLPDSSRQVRFSPASLFPDRIPFSMLKADLSQISPIRGNPA